MKISQKYCFTIFSVLLRTCK